MARINVNGQEYASVESMPPDVRALYQQMMGMFADTDGNQIPDILEGQALSGQTVTLTQGTINGQPMNPDEARRMVGEVLRTFDLDSAAPSAPAAPQWQAPRAAPAVSGSTLLIALLVASIVGLVAFILMGGP